MKAENIPASPEEENKNYEVIDEHEVETDETRNKRKAEEISELEKRIFYQKPYQIILLQIKL